MTVRTFSLRCHWIGCEISYRALIFKYYHSLGSTSNRRLFEILNFERASQQGAKAHFGKLLICCALVLLNRNHFSKSGISKVSTRPSFRARFTRLYSWYWYTQRYNKTDSGIKLTNNNKYSEGCPAGSRNVSAISEWKLVKQEALQYYFNSG